MHDDEVKSPPVPPMPSYTNPETEYIEWESFWCGVRFAVFIGFMLFVIWNAK